MQRSIHPPLQQHRAHTEEHASACSAAPAERSPRAVAWQPQRSLHRKRVGLHARLVASCSHALRHVAGVHTSQQPRVRRNDVLTALVRAAEQTPTNAVGAGRRSAEAQHALYRLLASPWPPPPAQRVSKWAP